MDFRKDGESVRMDRISSLPTELLCHIVCFLSAKEAAFAMVLSKRWQNLFTIIPELHFDDVDEKNCQVSSEESSEGSSEESSGESNEENFNDFFDGVMALPVIYRVKKFSLKWNHARFDERINTCLRNVLKRGVMVLKLQNKVVRSGYSYSLPSEVFTCGTLVKLKLGSSFDIDGLPVDASLPDLKTLCLDSVRFNDTSGRCAFTMLLSVSPVLEDLVIDRSRFERWEWCGTVSSSTLRRLTIRRRWFMTGDYSDFSDDSDNEYTCLDCRGLLYEFDRLSFDTPGLTYLEYSDYVPKEYPVVNLNSLVEAKLDLMVEYGSLWEEEEHALDFNPRNLMNGLTNVEILYVEIATVKMFNLFREATPVFEKLSEISLELFNHCWDGVPNLIEKSPNLKRLIIESSLRCEGYYVDGVCQCVKKYSFLASCPVETLIIKTYVGTVREVEQMKHFLGKLLCLEMVEVHCQASDEKKLQVMADLLMLPRASTRCKIQVKFSR